MYRNLTQWHCDLTRFAWIAVQYRRSNMSPKISKVDRSKNKNKMMPVASYCLRYLVYVVAVNAAILYKK